MTKLEFLIAVKELIAPESNRWTKHAEAKNATGLPVVPWAEDACQWCVSGAIRKIGYSSLTNLYQIVEIRDKLNTIVDKMKLGEYDIIDVNDNFGLDTVHLVLDKAIQDYRNDN